MKSASWAGEPPVRAPGTAAAAALISRRAALPAGLEGSAGDQAFTMCRPSRVQAAGETTVIRPPGAGTSRPAGSRISAGRSTPGPMPEVTRASRPARALAVAGLGGGQAAGQGQHDPGCDYDPSVGE